MPDSTLAGIDDRIYRSFRSLLHEREDAERVILAVIKVQHWWPAAGVAALVGDRDRRAGWARANATVGAAWGAAKLISRTVRRPRPNLEDCPPARRKTDRESFPSTHATVVFTAAIALRPLLPRTPLMLIALMTAGGRLLLGEHYPSDIAAGALLGTAVAAAYDRSAL